MYKKIHLCKITYKNELVAGIIDMKVTGKELCKHAKPGQFLNIKCENGLTAILRRPISICDIDQEKREVRFIFQIKGDGTRLLANKQIGESVDILGPLGNPFTISDKYSSPIIIGGGIGVFPLLMLAKKLQNIQPKILLGFRNKNLVVLENEFKKVSPDTIVATDDGSYGYHGYVTQLLKQNLESKINDIVYACGPEPMLKIIKTLCEEYRIPCQLSMEQRMGCGIGACLVCACKTKSKDNDWEYKHVCKDGPVFWGNEVIFDE